MKTIKFTKMQGSGNDFIVINNCLRFLVSNRVFVRNICDRKFGIGADGVLALGSSKKADAGMRIFNADGSEAEMCGNGARCAALYVHRHSTASIRPRIKIETKAGIIEAEVNQGNARIKLTDPKGLKLDMKVNAAGREYVVDYVDTGVPHAVIEVQDIESVGVKKIGRALRHHRVFKPAGTNVDFLQVRDREHIRVRTYERGVEDETLACGTGSVAAAIIATLNHSSRRKTPPAGSHKVFVATQSGEELQVFFKISKYKVWDVWLEGKAEIVYRGEIKI